MLGRQVGSSLLRLPIHARLVLRPTAPFQSSCPPDLAPRALLFSSQRYYATPGRPRKAVGEPSRPVKRAVKRQAKDTSGTDPATKLVKARKPAAKSTAKKAAPKSKAKAKKPVGRPKTKDAAPKKKPLTERQKRLRVEAKERSKINDLRALALKPPTTGRPRSAYQMFVQEKAVGKKGQRMAAMSKEWSQEWKSVTPAELEHYNHLAHEATAAAQAEMKRWVESHSPAQIKEANRARALLSKKLNGDAKTNKRNARYKAIPDERLPKGPISSYMLFSMNRQASGDFRSIAIAERGKLIGKEWAALTADEKKKYKDLQHEEQTRYSSEFKDTYGYVLPSTANSPQSAASASA